MEFQPSREVDKAYFESLNRACYEEVVQEQFGPWNEELQHSNFEIKWREQKFEKIIIDGNPVGAFWIQEREDSMQLRELQIHPDYQSQGIGTLIIRYAIELSRKMKKNLFLRVLFENRAFYLYKKLGFVEIGRNKHQYEMQYIV